MNTENMIRALAALLLLGGERNRQAALEFHKMLVEKAING